MRYCEWLRRLPHPYPAADYCYQLSIWQIELSLTQVLDRPVGRRVFFEQVIRENLGWRDGRNSWRTLTSCFGTLARSRGLRSFAHEFISHEAADSGLCFWIPYFMTRYIRVFRVMPKYFAARL